MSSVRNVNVRSPAIRVHSILTNIAAKLEIIQAHNLAIARGDRPDQSTPFYGVYIDQSGTPATLGALAKQFDQLGYEIETLVNSLASDVNGAVADACNISNDNLADVRESVIDTRSFFRHIPASVIFRRSNADMSRSFTSAVDYLHDAADSLNVDIKLLATALEYHFFGHDSLALRHLRTGGVSAFLASSIIMSFEQRFPRNAGDGANRG